VYEGFKHIHALFAVLSFVLLIARLGMGWNSPEKLNAKFLKVVPHAVDGLLVVSIIAILVSGGAHPFTSAFHTEKFVGFIVYIAFSVLAVLTLRGRFSSKLKVPFALIALLSWLWLAHVAFAKQPLIFAAA